MITVTKNSLTDMDISFSQAEKFEISVSLDDGIELSENDTLVFEAAKNDSSESIIKKTITAMNNQFTITLTNVEKESLGIGNHIYRMTITQTGTNEVTYISGNFKMKWGA